MSAGPVLLALAGGALLVNAAARSSSAAAPPPPPPPGMEPPDLAGGWTYQQRITRSTMEYGALYVIHFTIPGVTSEVDARTVLRAHDFLPVDLERDPADLVHSWRGTAEWTKRGSVIGQDDVITFTAVELLSASLIPAT